MGYYYSFSKRNRPRQLNVVGTSKLLLWLYRLFDWGKKNETAQKFIVKGKKLIADVIKMSPNNATAYAFKVHFLVFALE